MRRVVVLIVALGGLLALPAEPAGAEDVTLYRFHRDEELSGCVRWGYPDTIAVGDEWDIAYVCAHEWTYEYRFPFSGNENVATSTGTTGTAHCVRRVNAQGVEYDDCPGSGESGPIPFGTIRRDGAALVLRGAVHSCAVDVRLAMDVRDQTDPTVVRDGQYVQGRVTGATGVACGHDIGGTDRATGRYWLYEEAITLVAPDLP